MWLFVSGRGRCQTNVSSTANIRIRPVFLEANWVLRSTYKFDERGVRDAFTRLLGWTHVHTEDKPSMAEALALAARGVDLADAIHLTARPAGATFTSLDKSLVACAERAGVDAVRLA